MSPIHNTRSLTDILLTLGCLNYQIAGEVMPIISFGMLLEPHLD